MCISDHIYFFSKLFDLTGKRIAAPIAHSQHNAVIAACFLSGTVCTFIFHTILIKTAHLRSCDLADPVLLKILHQIDFMFSDHICSDFPAQLDHIDLMLLFSEECRDLTADHSSADNKDLFPRRARSIQHSGTREDFRLVNSFNWQNQWLCASSNDHGVRIFFADQLQGNLLIQNDPDTILFTAVNVGAYHIGNISLSRWKSSQAHVPSEHMPCFKKRNAVTTFCCHKSSAQTANTAADHHHLL